MQHTNTNLGVATVWKSEETVGFLLFKRAHSTRPREQGRQSHEQMEGQS